MTDKIIMDAENNYLRNGSVNTGVKIGDHTTAGFGYADIKGILQVSSTGVNAPTYEDFVTGVKRLGYNASDTAIWEYHLEHNQQNGGDKLTHLHIGKSSGATASGSNLSIAATILHSRGHGHKNWSTGVIPASPAAISKTFTMTPAQFNNIGDGSHDIVQLLIAQSGGGTGLLDSDLWLPDDNITMYLTVSTIPTLTGGLSNKVFIPFADIHAGVIDGSGTKYMDTNNAGNSFYAV